MPRALVQEEVYKEIRARMKSTYHNMTKSKGVEARQDGRRRPNNNRSAEEYSSRLSTSTTKFDENS